MPIYLASLKLTSSLFAVRLLIQKNIATRNDADMTNEKLTTPPTLPPTMAAMLDAAGFNSEVVSLVTPPGSGGTILGVSVGKVVPGSNVSVVVGKSVVSA